MARYVDSFVLPVPRTHITAYRRVARKAPEAMPFDGRRMFWSGFKAQVEY